MARSAHALGEIAKSRRTKLGRTQMQVVELANERMGARVISEPTYRAIETGRQLQPSERTLAAASVGLDWPADALQQISSGADPAAFSPIIESGSRLMTLEAHIRADDTISSEHKRALLRFLSAARAEVRLEEIEEREA